MNILQLIKEDKQVRKYWKNLLGEELLEKILDESKCEEYLKQGLFLEKQELKELLRPLPERKEPKENWSGIFYPFYYRISCYVERKLLKVFRKRHLIFDAEELAQILKWQFVKRIEEIPLRCLLQEMEDLKCEKKLQGQDEKQEYKFFVEEYLGRNEYLEELIAKYPFMMEMVFSKTKSYLSGLNEMLFRLERDKQEIENCLCNGKIIKNVVAVESWLSDEHNPGRTVARLIFDNGIVVYYKPRSLRPELEYQKLYQWSCEKCNLKYYDRGILDYGTHGWEREVKNEVCKKESEIWRYYKRLGIHLCLAYLFGISDIHFENIVACGEYPVLIDMETFPGYKEYDVVQDSVLGTGILPCRTWGISINISAMGNVKRQKTPFKLPVIKEKNTSNMHIAYEQKELNCEISIPKLQDKNVDPGKYSDAVEMGFGQVYEWIIRYRVEFLNRISATKFWQSRYVMRHTQQYKMYQMMATFPEFMIAPETRRLMLLRMSRGLKCQEKYKAQLLFYEVEAVMQGLFPVYYVSERDLEDGNGDCIRDYFKESVQEQIISRIKRMDQKDRYRQQKFIELSMEAEYGDNTEKFPKEKGTLVTASQIMKLIQQDMEDIADEAQWIELKYDKNGGWHFQPMGMYLYDGLAGIAVFFMSYGNMYGMDRDRKLREQIFERLFAYTDSGSLNLEKLESRCTGIMDGEASMVYTYLILYKISGENRFLEYAKKHAGIVERLLEEDKQFDIMEGNAGAMIAFVHLYNETGQKYYLEVAQRAAEMVMAHGIHTEHGVGWILPGMKQPLAGMAHGNSGIMLALARVGEATGGEYYFETILQARQYEDFLYDETIRNWEDIRGTYKGNGKDVTAWCHGAAGILIAIVQIDQVLGQEVVDDWRWRKAQEKIRSIKRKEWCLCHGNMGNGAAVRYGGNKVHEMGFLSEQIETPDWEALLPNEKYQMGFMTGMSGIGYELLKGENPQLPEIIALEL